METEVTIIGWSEDVMNSYNLTSNDKVLFCQLQHEALSKGSELFLAPLAYLNYKTGIPQRTLKRSIEKLQSYGIIHHEKYGRDRYFRILV